MSTMNDDRHLDANVRLRYSVDGAKLPFESLVKLREEIKNAQKASEGFNKSLDNLRGTHILGQPANFTVFLRNMKVVKNELKDLENAAKNGRAGRYMQADWDKASIGIQHSLQEITKAEARALKGAVMTHQLKGLSNSLNAVGQQALTTGQRLTMGLTLPIVMFGQKSLQSFISLNKEFTRFNKVINDIDVSTKKLEKFDSDGKLVKTMAGIRAEVKGLGKEFGITSKATANLYADLAAQGYGYATVATGIKGVSTEVGLAAHEIERISTLGDIDMDTAQTFFRNFRATFYGQMPAADAIKGVANDMNLFNQIENQTAIGLKDLAAGFPKVANVAANFGVNAKELAAMLAGIFEVIPDAEANANALKFIFARISAPNDATLKKFKEFHIDLDNIIKTTDGMGTIVKVFDEVGTAAGGLTKGLNDINGDSLAEMLNQLMGNRQAFRLIPLMKSLTKDFTQTATEGFNQVKEASAGFVASLEKAGSPDEAVKNWDKIFKSSTQNMDDFQKGLVLAELKTEDTGGKIAKILDKASQAELDIKMASPEMKLQILKTKWQDFLASMGEQLIGPLTEFFGQLIKVAEWFNNLSATTKKTAMYVLAMTAAFAPLVTALGVAWTFMSRILKTAVGIRQIFSTMKMVMPSVIDARKDGVAGKGVFSMFGAAFEKVRGNIQDAGDAATIGSLAKVFEPQTEIVSTAMGKMVSAVQEGMAAMVETVRGTTLDDALGGTPTAGRYRDRKGRFLSDKEIDAGRQASQVNQIDDMLDTEAIPSVTRTKPKPDDMWVDAPAASDGPPKGWREMYDTPLPEEAVNAETQSGSRFKKFFGKKLSTGIKEEENVVVNLVEGAENAKIKTTFKELLKPKSFNPFYGWSIPLEETRKKLKDIWANRDWKAFGNSVKSSFSDIGTKWKKYGDEGTSIFASVNRAGTKVFKGFKGAGEEVWAGLKKVPTNLKEGGIRGIFPALGNTLKGGGLGLGKMFAGGAGGIMEMIGPMVKLSAVFTGVGAAVAVVAGLFFMFKKNIKQVMDGIKDSGALDGLSKAWNKLKKAFSEVGDIFVNKVGKTVGASETGDKAKNMWTAIGGVIGNIVKVFAKVVTGAAWLVKKLKTYWEEIADKISHTIGFISSIFSGHWKDALKYAAAIVIDIFALPIAHALDWVVHMVVSGIAAVLKTIGKIPIVGKPFKAAAEGLEEMDRDFDPARWIKEKVDSMFDGDNRNIKEKAKKIGSEIGKGINYGISQEKMDAIQQSFDDASKKFQDFRSAFKSALDSALSEQIAKAQKAFENMVKKRLEGYDNQVKAIEKLNEADQKKYEQEDYLTNRRKMLQDRAYQHENYRRNRSLALYEGKIDEVRQLDMQEAYDKKNHEDSIAEMEKQRNRKAVQERRDAEIKKIQDAKDAESARLDILKEAFQKEIEELKNFTPKSAAEYRERLGQINSVLQKYGVPAFADTAILATDTIKNAMKEAMKALESDAFWTGTGESAAQQFIAGFQKFLPADILKSTLTAAAGAPKDGATLADNINANASKDSTGGKDTKDMIARNEDVGAYINSDVGKSQVNTSAKKGELSAAQDWLHHWYTDAYSHHISGSGLRTLDTVKSLANKGVVEALNGLIAMNLISFKTTKTGLYYDGSNTADKLKKSGFWNQDMKVPMHHSGGPIKYHSGGMNGLASDERPAILQTGEYVVQRSAVAKIGAKAMEFINKTGRLPGKVASGFSDNYKADYSRMTKTIDKLWDESNASIIRKNTGLQDTLRGNLVKHYRTQKTLTVRGTDGVESAMFTSWGNIGKKNQQTWDSINKVTNNSVDVLISSVSKGADGLGKGFGKAATHYGRVGTAIEYFSYALQSNLNEFTTSLGIGNVFKPKMDAFHVPTFHKGGIVGKGGYRTNLRGRGVKSDEQLALLQKGERVLTKKEQGDGEGLAYGGTNVLASQSKLEQLFLAAIRKHESGGNYQAVNKATGNASGAYQFLRSTWNKWEGYMNAYQAPPESQDRRAVAYLNMLKGVSSTDPRIWSLGWYGGPGVARKGLKGPVKGGPSSKGNTLSWEGFANDMAQIMGDISGGKVVMGSAGSSFQDLMYSLLGNGLSRANLGKTGNKIAAGAGVMQIKKALDFISQGNNFFKTSWGGGGLANGASGGDINDLASWAGKSGSDAALIAYMKKTGVPHRVSSMFRPGSKTHASGKASYHSMHRAVDFAGLKAGNDTPELLNIFKAFGPAENYLRELIYSGAPYYIGGGKKKPISALDRITYGDHHNHVHAALSQGGIIKGSRRGMNILGGEGGRSEMVVPLPKFNLDKILTSFASPVMIGKLYKDISNAARNDRQIVGGYEEVHYHTIQVENFIGQEEWFNQMMKDHNISVVKPKQQANGVMNRRVGSMKDNLVRY